MAVAGTGARAEVPAFGMFAMILMSISAAITSYAQTRRMDPHEPRTRNGESLAHSPFR